MRVWLHPTAGDCQKAAEKMYELEELIKTRVEEINKQLIRSRIYVKRKSILNEERSTRYSAARKVLKKSETAI